MSARVAERLAACVALPSPTPPGDVARVADWTAAWAARFGASVTRQYVTPEGCNVLAGEVLLTAVMGEEAGGLGSAHLVAEGLSADFAVVGEPTGPAVARAHKGTYMKRLRFTGRAAHSASPWLGRSAVAASERETVRPAASQHAALGPATMTVTVLSGGSRIARRLLNRTREG